MQILIACTSKSDKMRRKMRVSETGYDVGIVRKRLGLRRGNSKMDVSFLEGRKVDARARHQSGVWPIELSLGILRRLSVTWM